MEPMYTALNAQFIGLLREAGWWEGQAMDQEPPDLVPHTGSGSRLPLFLPWKYGARLGCVQQSVARCRISQRGGVVTMD